eukprot:975636-Pyramimonas_sp.AAC.1
MGSLIGVGTPLQQQLLTSVNQALRARHSQSRPCPHEQCDGVEGSRLSFVRNAMSEKTMSSKKVAMAAATVDSTSTYT